MPWLRDCSRPENSLAHCKGRWLRHLIAVDVKGASEKVFPDVGLAD
jgi:hypothetical protein